MSQDVSLTAARRMELAYLAVFGDPSKRGTDQALVWADIESFCHAHRLSSSMADDHAIDPLSCVFNDGKRSVWLRARGFVIKAIADPAKAPIISRKSKSNQNPNVR